MKLNLKDITILIPTYKRNNFLFKNLRFWENYKINIIILDGGKKKQIKKNLNILKIILNIYLLKILAKVPQQS